MQVKQFLLEASAAMLCILLGKFVCSAADGVSCSALLQDYVACRFNAEMHKSGGYMVG